MLERKNTARGGDDSRDGGKNEEEVRNQAHFLKKGPLHVHFQNISLKGLLFCILSMLRRLYENSMPKKGKAFLRDA